jgi:glycerophosphoryl diester phosphodiesterase
MTKIIGHRGAAGLALENTPEAFRAGIRAGVDAIEFDVQATSDGKLVICHDSHLAGISESNAIIQNLTYDELRQIPLNNGEHVPTLREILDIAGDTPVIIEIKIKGFTKEICEIVAEYPHLDVTFASFKRGIIRECRELRPDIPALVAEHGSHPLEIIRTANAENATGIDLNFRLLNPLTYWLCRRRNLQIMIYTVNSKFVGNFIRRLYPTVWICTNFPNKFIKE